jgi:hypothetical protein
MISLVTSLVGAEPGGGVTVGSFESGPLAGVLTVAAGGVVAVAGVLDVAVARAESELFSLPGEIVPVEPLEPQPAIRSAAPSATTAAPGRVGVLLK